MEMLLRITVNSLPLRRYYQRAPTWGNPEVADKRNAELSSAQRAGGWLNSTNL